MRRCMNDGVFLAKKSRFVSENGIFFVSLQVKTKARNNELLHKNISKCLIVL